MPKIFCCLCSRRTDAQKQRIRVGNESNWPMLIIHAEKNGLDIDTFSRDDYVCLKCHSTISHHRMKDRGPNKVIKNFQPTAHEPGITKNVLRGYTKPGSYGCESSSVVSSNERKDLPMVQNPDTHVLVTVPSTANSELTSAVSDFERNNFPTVRDSDTHVGVTVPSTATASNEDAAEGYSASSSNSELSVASDASILPAVQCEGTLSGEGSGNVEAISQQPSIESTDATGTQIVGADTPIMAGDTTEITVESLAAAVPQELSLQGVKSTQARCFICNSKNGRKALPWTAIQQAWFETRCFIPKTNRACEEHLCKSNKFTEDALQNIGQLKRNINIRIAEFQQWFNAVSDLPKDTPYNFDEDGIEEEKYKMFLGIDKASFDDLLQHLKGMRNTSTRSLRNALAMFLLLLRNNMKQEIIAYNFSTTQQVVSKTIDAVATALHEHFVPKYLGYHHMTREEAIRKHSIQLTSKVLDQPESRLCLIADGTYNYIERPADFELQRKTFSAHKKRNLIKPLYIVLPTGYILEAAGPYFCDARNNDAANISHHYKNSDLLLYMEDDDYFLLDRGYRDVVDETERNGISVFMPSLLTGKRTHFTCEEGNSSRKVTMFRWVVESVNGRIKNVFPFFKHTIEGTYVPKVMMFNRIACAIMNAYFPLLYKNNEFHDVISEVCSNEIPQTNSLKDEIEELGLRRMTTRWERASATCVPDFPMLSMDDLKRITLGTFQIKIAGRYIDNHLRKNSEFGIFIHREMDGLIRARLQSRFSKSKTHDTFVKFEFEEEMSGYEAIKGLYCTCKVGERTLGCCSHLTAVIRYLGFDRHQPQKTKVQSRFTWDAIDCAEYSDSSSGEASENDECDV